MLKNGILIKCVLVLQCYLGGSKSPVTCDFFCMKVNSILQCVNFIKYYIQNAKSVILALVANIKKSNNYT